VSELFEVLTWLAYVVAAVMMLGVIAAAILTGLALRLVAEFLREFTDGREAGDAQYVEDRPRRPE
jgi:hypothetical protein